MKKFSYPHFTLSNQLTREQIDFFEEYGFLHFKKFINPSAVSEIIKASLEVQEKWVLNNVEKVNGVPIKYGHDVDGTKIVHRFAFLSLHHPVLSEFLRDPRFSALLPLLGALDARIGEQEKDGMVLNHYVNTENSNFTKMGWHTDALRDVFYGKKIMPMLNVGIHLSTAVPNNGGLRIIPKSHKQGLFDLLFRKKYFLDNNPDPDEIGLAPEAGDLTVHDGRLWHRVAQSALIGEASRRRVIYVPFISGKYQPKNEKSSTQLYQRFARLVK
jgi:phytanoyl-CoA hydroxylase